MTKRQKTLVRVGLFSTVFMIILLLLNSLFQPVWLTWNNYYTINGFYEEPDNTIETVFVGASIVSRAIIPTELYEEYGMCAYNLGTENQPMDVTYYWTEEAYRKHPETLKTVVVDVSGLRSGAPEAFYHKAYDDMEFSDVKWRAVKDYTEGDYTDMASYFFPLISYHSRWDSLTKDDFLKYTEDPVNGTRGYHYVEKLFLEGSVEHAYMMNPVLDETATSDAFRENSLAYMEKLITFCKEKDIELVFVKSVTTRWSSGLHNEVAKLADEHGIKFVDYNFEPYFSEVDFAHAFDTTDGNHLNYNGASKFTKHLGQYLVDNCEVTDIRGDEKYLHMEEQLAEYKLRVGLQVALQESVSVEDYLKIASAEGNSVIMSVKNDAANSLSEEQRKVFAELGFEKLAKLDIGDSYLAVMEDGKVIEEKIKENTEESNKKSISHKGRFADGTSFEIVSGGAKHGDISSCLVNGEEHAKNENGLNILVYNKDIEKVVDSTVFYTNAEQIRQVYAKDTVTMLKENLDSSKYATGSLYYNVSRYLERMEERQNKKYVNSLPELLNQYANDENMIVLFAVKDDVVDRLSDDVRDAVEKYGLKELTQIRTCDSYAAYIDGGVAKEVTATGVDAAILKVFGVEINSEGRYAGTSASIKVNGVEYSPNAKGVNVVVFDKERNCVVEQKCF